MPGFERSDAQKDFDGQLGFLLSNARQLRGVSQAALAIKLGISKGSLAHIELGHTTCPTFLLVRITRLLDVTPYYLLKDIDVPDQPLENWRALLDDEPVTVP